VFIWDGVNSEYGGRHNINVALNVDVGEEKIVYTMKIENKSEFVVENVYCPYIGDLSKPENESHFERIYQNYCSVTTDTMYPRFDYNTIFHAVDYPTQVSSMAKYQYCGTPPAPFVLLKGDYQGFYMGIDKDCGDEVVTWVNELRPGYEDTIDYLAPKTKEIGGKDVHVRVATVHIPYIMPGETRTLTPIAIQAYAGDWHVGADIYKEWRKENYKLAKPPKWVTEPHAWQQIHINSLEDELRCKYTDLVKYGEDCVRHGIKAIQLVGWNLGGQDQGNPSHSTDPRLGTTEELRAAIKKIEAMGVKIIIFSKYTWADTITDYYKDFDPYVAKDPYGQPYQFSGWSYQTVTQLFEINTKRLRPMCFTDECRKLYRKEFQKVIDLGASGILYDECQHHTPAVCCFDPEHDHRPGASVYRNDNLLIEEFSKMVDCDDFLFAGEACYDKEYEQYHLAYFRSWNTKNHIAFMRYLLPKIPLVVAVSGFNDRNMINQCLMNRYIISYEPYFFKGRLDDYPDTLEYGKKIDSLRTELRKWLWDGEFKDTVGFKILKVGGREHTQYSSFRADDESYALVICNYEDEVVVVNVKRESGKFNFKWRVCDVDEWSVSTDITIPKRSAVVLIEQ
jgi:hypothetical protein